MNRLALACSAALLFAAHAPARSLAQTFTTGPCHADDSNSGGHDWFSGSHARVCELRRTTLPLLNGQLNVSGKNDGIEVIGEDRSDIALEAQVSAQSSDRQSSEALLHKIEIITTGTIQARGPQSSGWSKDNWSVNYRLHVPRRLGAHLHTENGGIELANLDGDIHAETTNGGLTLSDLAGDIQATTVNGGVHVTLTGDQWRGGGLSARSTNGGISVKGSTHYSAHLIAQTEHGGISLGYPFTVRGTFSNRVETNIGEGGPTLQFQTVNGGVSINQN